MDGVQGAEQESSSHHVWCQQKKKGERKEDLAMTNKTGRRNYPFVGAGKDSAGDVGIVGASEQRERVRCPQAVGRREYFLQTDRKRIERSLTSHRTSAWRRRRSTTAPTE